MATTCLTSNIENRRSVLRPSTASVCSSSMQNSVPLGTGYCTRKGTVFCTRRHRIQSVLQNPLCTKLTQRVLTSALVQNIQRSPFIDTLKEVFSTLWYISYITSCTYVNVPDNTYTKNLYLLYQKVSYVK